MFTTLPWFNAAFPLYLAPMAGVTDKIFRQICKRTAPMFLSPNSFRLKASFGATNAPANILISPTCERPLGVQLFGANPAHMAEAAKQVVDWVAPGFHRPELWLPG